MREFAKAQFRLREAPRSLRVIYGGFLGLVALGFLTQLGFQIGRIGMSPASIARYYRGSEESQVMAFPKSFGQLLEVSHAHAFMMAVVFLILAHLFVATGAPASFKTIVLTATFGGMLGDLAAPWLIRYGAAWWAWLDVASWTAQNVGSMIAIGLSGWECCGVRGETAASDALATAGRGN